MNTYADRSDAFSVRESAINTNRANLATSGFAYIIVACLIALFAVFNFILTKRTDDDYGVLRWITMMPLSLIVGVSIACFLAFLGFVYAGHSLARVLHMFGIVMVVSLLIFGFLVDPSEFDNINPARFPIFLDSMFMIAGFVVMTYTMFLFTGNSVRLDNMNFLSLASFYIMASLYFVSYASTTLSVALVDAVKRGGYEYSAAAYFGMCFLVYGAFVIFLLASEAVIMRIMGFHTGDLHTSFNTAPVEIHDAVDATYTTGFYSVISAVLVPVVSMWILRDNVTPMKQDDVLPDAENIGWFTLLALVAAPLSALGMSQVIRGDYMGHWVMNFVSSVIVSFMAVLVAMNTVVWDKTSVMFLLAMGFALDIGLDFQSRGSSGQAVHYTLIAVLSHELSWFMDTDETSERDSLLMSTLISVLFLAFDMYVHNQEGKSITAPLTVISFSVFRMIASLFGDGPPALEKPESYGDYALQIIMFFAVTNILLNARLESLPANQLSVDNKRILAVVVGAAGAAAQYFLDDADILREWAIMSQAHTKDYRDSVRYEIEEL